MANPTLLTMPMCVNADKNTIPPTDAGTSGLFSEEYGWQNINSLPLASGGKAPNRRDFNGVFALLGGIAYACQRGYTFTWDATQDYEVGCIVIDSTDGKKYECVSDVTANATPPSADSTHWKLATDIAWFIRQPSTAYALGTVVYLPSIGAALYLECTTAGTTDSGDLVISTPTPNSTVSDGTVVWTICKSANTQDLANYLPLAGGAMTGGYIYRSVNNDIFRIVGGPQKTNAPFIQLNGTNLNGNPASFVLCAKNDIHNHILRGNIDGTLTWDGAKVLTEASGLTREITPAFNTRDVITTSGTYTAPVTGWYKITAKGGGGGGGCGMFIGSGYNVGVGGDGGGEGGTTITYVNMTAGGTATVVIGAGGTHSTTHTAPAGNGGDTSVTINGNTYTGGGGGGGYNNLGHAFQSMGGSGTIPGMAGCSGDGEYSFDIGRGGTGGGAGGAGGASNIGNNTAPSPVANSGGGGGGGCNGNGYTGTASDGADGFVWFEYFATI